MMFLMMPRERSAHPNRGGVGLVRLLPNGTVMESGHRQRHGHGGIRYHLQRRETFRDIREAVIYHAARTRRC